VVVRSDAEAAAEDDGLRPEDVDERADAGAEVASDFHEQLLCLRVALVREPYEPVRVRRRAELLACRLGDRRSADVRLEMAAPGAGALAGPALVHDHDVAELGTGAVPASEGSSAGDDPTADA